MSAIIKTSTIMASRGSSLTIIAVVVLAEGLENIGLHCRFTLLFCYWCFAVVLDSRGFSLLSLRICTSRLWFHYKFGHPALAPCDACPTVSLHMKISRLAIYRGGESKNMSFAFKNKKMATFITR